MSTTPDRATQNALSFVDTILAAGGFRLRPLSYALINHLRLLEMQLGAGKEAMDALTGEQKLDQIHAFLYIQAGPLPEVARAVRAYVKARSSGTDQATAWEDWLINHVDPFLTQIPPDGIAAAMEQIEQLGEVDAAIVTAEPPAHHKPERQDPN
jgi:hypothetical protein